MPVVPLTLQDPTLLLQRIALDVDPELGPLRELTMNGVQACQAAGGGEVRWTVRRIDGVPRLAVVDQGIGMTASDASRYLGRLGLSGQADTSLGANHGIGGRLTLLAASPAGVLYRTWARPGRGVALRLGMDPSTGQFGLVSDERGRTHRPVSWTDAPAPIRSAGHGTEVVLLGRPDHPDSTQPLSPGEPRGHVRRGLNSRFATIPDGIAVIVDGPLEPSDLPAAASGARHDLDDRATDRGVVGLTSATAHWWLLPRDSPEPVNTHLDPGYVASLYQQELYDLHPARRGGFARMSQFGIRVGQDRVCIWIEPVAGLVASSPSRRSLSLRPDRPEGLWPGESALPWVQWAAEFSRRLPPALAQLALDADSAAEGGADMRRSIARLLRNDPGLTAIPRYRPSGRRGGSEGATTNVGRGDNEASLVPESARARGAREALALFGDLLTQSDDGRRTRENLRRRAHGGSRPVVPVRGHDGTSGPETESESQPGRTSPRRHRIREDDLPHARWISVQDETRPVGYLDDRVANFDEGRNELTINADHRLFRALVQALAAEHAARPSHVVETLAGRIARREWYLHLAATIMRTRELEVAEAWSEGAGTAMRTPEALTAAVAYGASVHVRAKRAMRSRLGSPDGDPTSTSE